MTRIVTVGAPSLTGEAVAQILAAQFSAEDFPLVVEIENRMPFPVTLTEAGGILLGHVADLDNATGRGEFQNIGQMVRCLTSIEQLAEHHGYPVALILHFATPEGEQDSLDLGTAELLPAELPPIDQPPAIDPPEEKPTEQPPAGDTEGGPTTETKPEGKAEEPAAVAPRRGRPPRNA